MILKTISLCIRFLNIFETKSKFEMRKKKTKQQKYGTRKKTSSFLLFYKLVINYFKRKKTEIMFLYII